MSLKRKLAKFFGIVTKAEKHDTQETRDSCQRDSDRIVAAEKRQAEASIRNRAANDRLRKQIEHNETLSGKIMANLKTRKIDRNEDLDEHDTTEAVGLF